jgi:hypothetical protein
MKKKILIGSILAVALLTLVSFSSAVGYNVVKDTQEEIIKDEYDGYPPIAIVLQLISKLRNHKDIESVEMENDVFQIIESDAELNGIIEKLKSFDCECEPDITVLGDSYSVICILLHPIFNVAYFLFESTNHPLTHLFAEIIFIIGVALRCYWTLI